MNGAPIRSSWMVPAVVLAGTAAAIGFFLWHQPSPPGGAEPLPYGLRMRQAGEDPAAYVRSQFEACFRQGLGRWRSPCYRELARLMAEQFSLRASLAALAQVQGEPGIDGQCHSLTHFLAHEELRRTGSAAETFGQCQIVCGEGCWHGTVEAHITERGLGGADDTAIARAVAGACGGVRSDPRPAVYGHCVHGIGHAFMLITDLDLPRSLALCDQFERLSERDPCWSGALMENAFSAANPDHPSRFFRADDPTYLCTILSPQHRETCYASQSAVVLGPGDWGAATAFCGGLPGGAVQGDHGRTFPTSAAFGFRKGP